MNISPKAKKIYIVSGGIGSSGLQVVNTVLAQFPDQNIALENITNIRDTLQIQYLIQQALNESAFIVHTLVDSKLSSYLITQAAKHGIPAVDLMGDLITWLSDILKQEPLQKPGRYRQLRREYYDRVDAIHYSIDQDDGKNPQGWSEADIILIGVSRSGKTPLSMYLAVLGWKVANIPLIPQLPIHESIFKLDARRQIGLIIDAAELIVFRTQRMARMGISSKSAYTDPSSINEELEFARNIYRRGRFKTIDVTNKTIESCADEIIRHLATFHNGQVYTSSNL